MHKKVIVFFALVTVASFLIASCSSHIVLGVSENSGKRIPLQQRPFSEFISKFLSGQLTGSDIIALVEIVMWMTATAMDNALRGFMNDINPSPTPVP